MAPGTGILLLLGGVAVAWFSFTLAKLNKVQGFKRLNLLWRAALPIAIVAGLWTMAKTDLGQPVGPVSAQATGGTISSPSGGNNAVSSGQQGGITAGSIGTIVNTPPAPRADRTGAISMVGQLMVEATRILEMFESTNDVDLIKRQYEDWAPRAERQIAEALDETYAIQLRNAPPFQYARIGMATAGMGYWQQLKGKTAVLSGFVTELRSASR